MHAEMVSPVLPVSTVYIYILMCVRARVRVCYVFYLGLYGVRHGKGPFR